LLRQGIPTHVNVLDSKIFEDATSVVMIPPLEQTACGSPVEGEA
jgi:hypothetical protein